MTTSSPTDDRVSTGIAGLDEILDGGLPAKRSYLLRGGPGSGKTTTGLHFLTDGGDPDRTSLLITFGESGARDVQVKPLVPDRLRLLLQGLAQ